jgi:Tfp pilus assembly protein PilF
VTFRRPLSSLLGPRACLLAGLAAGLLSGTVRAADRPDEPPQFAEKTGEALQKLQPLIDAKDWDGALAVLNGALAFAGPDSYDRAIIMDTVAKLEFQKDATPLAIAAWEEALRLSDAHPNYFKAKERLDLILSLAQTYSQIGQSTKDVAVARTSFAKAADYIRRWLEATPKPTFETENFYALVLYSQATANEKKIDIGLLKQAQAAADKALHLQIHPRESLLVLINAIYQQTNDLANSARYLELLARQNPDKEGYWQQLWATYMNLAAESDKDEEKSREFYALAINTVERAQAYGKMRSKKDNYSLATMYFSAGQYGKATELLATGLRSGAIDPSFKNWDYLAFGYQQINQPKKAIEAFKDAEKVLPENGEVDFEIAKIYAQLENSTEAYNYYKAATTKGNLEKPYLVYQFLAYEAYEQEKYQEAMDAANKASEYPQAKSSTQLANLKKMIDQSLTMQKNAAAADTPAPAATTKQ